MTTRLNIDTKPRLPPSPLWSPIQSHSPLVGVPHSPSNGTDDLSQRCRKLARSFGEHAITDSFEGGGGSSPSRSREPSNELSSPLSPPSNPTTPNRHHHLPMSPPTPEGSHVLNEILEEEPEEGTNTPRGGGGETEGLGFGTTFEPKVDVERSFRDDEPMQFKMSPPWTTQDLPMSLDGASIALGGATTGVGESTLGLTLHDHFQSDAMSIHEDFDENLKNEIKRGKTWFNLELSLVDGELLIGSSESDRLDPARSFSSRYVEPLLRLFEEDASPSSPFTPHHRRRSSSASQRPESTLPSASRPIYLALTLNTSPSITLQYLHSALEPLHDSSLLTTYCPNARLTTKAPIMVLISHRQQRQGTEDAVDLSEVIQNLSSPSFIYEELSIDQFMTKEDRHIYDKERYPIVVARFSDLSNGAEGRLDEEVKERIRKQVEMVHERGMLLKYEGIPRFPVHAHKLLENELNDLGVDFVL